ncbi:alpha/beta hydrolase [uncultured Sneathiella sp.]|jgi:pimeloyl-ACP methyl ester carboxylesterase|uniref:alpha/beta fold hydrolase n=1 Tax=uncultured Sneathiella sp. TaxID=879315 RepID=UPI0030DA0524|tara:strand:+ start:161 stop:1054 length:894 start_codon:yes stop_codon:yes gene_type:complete
MPKISVNGVELEYETRGESSGEPIVLIGGVGVQLAAWNETFLKALADNGFYVILYDNRDVGKSTKFDDWGQADIPAAFAQARARETVSAPYTLEDMADDAAELIVALGIEKAHFLGSSNGGAIAQTLAYRRPERVKSLISVMATSARRGLPRPEAKAAEWLTKPRNPAGTLEGAMDEAVETAGIIGSPGFPRDEASIREEAAMLYKRSFYPDGNSRHLLASLASGDSRVAHLSEITAPTMVIHGREDPLVPLGCAEDVQKSIPGAEIVVIDGMGHDIPDGAVPTIVDAITRNAKKAN